MKTFHDFKVAMQKQFDKMSNYELFTTEIGKDELWETYLSSFPEGTNKLFRERTEYDCQCCKQFIRACGNVVSIVDNKLVSIWDIDIGDHYQVVSDTLSNLVKSTSVKDIFLHREKKLGTDFNHQLLDNGETVKWNHFYYELPTKFVKTRDSIATMLSEKRSTKDVFKRGLEEISIGAAETVLELIEQNSIYRGDEHKQAVEFFITHKKEFMSLDSGEEDNYCWNTSSTIGQVSRTRNTAIGTLLVDISNGVSLDDAVKMFESKVAPTNYKRPTALITKGMIDKAQKKVAELGIENSLSRRYAVAEDITINNVLFADRSAKKAMNVFEELAAEAPANIKNLEKVDSIDIETFVETILPKSDSIEILLENKHINNLMSLIAPTDQESKNIFKWKNNFSWAYNGEVTDSIKERVKKAGGNVTGVLRCSLSWFNYDDLDIHVIEPDGKHIYYSNKSGHRSTGKLDVDMNVGSNGSRNAVENIVWGDKSKMQEGIYNVFIHNYTPRESTDIGFDVEIEFDSVIHSFHYDKKVSGNVQVAKFEFSRENGIKFTESLPLTNVSKEVWGISTQQFRKVSMIMNSPNHWDGNKTGNKHYFFMLEGCKNSESARGFFNEFLDEDLREHRKVFEVLGSKMKTEKTENQLSGIGFSSTQRSSIFCKVSGSFSRTVRVNF